MASRHFSVVKQRSAKAAARPQGIQKATIPSKPRRSLRLLALQASCQSVQVSGITEQQPDNNAKKRKHESINKTPSHLVSKRQRLNPIEHWRREGDWPKELFEPSVMPTLDSKSEYLARSLSRKRSIGGSSTSSRDLSREEKAAPYEKPRYEQMLELSGVFMRDDTFGPSEEDIKTYRGLFEKHVELPQDTGFEDQLFEQTMRNCHAKNEARIIRDIGLLVCPSPEDFLKRGATSMKHLCESVDEAWSLSNYLTSPRPQPDFSVGFTREAFSEQQLEKVRLILGNSDNQASYFRATWYMYFPFLGCEAKKGDGALDVADRQNAHSMGIAVRGVVALYRLAGRVEQIDGKMLAFSISYSDTYVRIYSYYPRVKSAETRVYRHRVADIALRDSKLTRWRTYKFVKSIYEHWAPSHLVSLKSILDEMEAVEAAPLIRPAASREETAAPSERTGVSQIFSCSSLCSEEHSVEPTTPTEVAAAMPDTRPIERGVDSTKTTTKRRVSSRSSKIQPGG